MQISKLGVSYPNVNSSGLYNITHGGVNMKIYGGVNLSNNNRKTLVALQ